MVRPDREDTGPCPPDDRARCRAIEPCPDCEAWARYPYWRHIDLCVVGAFACVARKSPAQEAGNRPRSAPALRRNQRVEGAIMIARGKLPRLLNNGVPAKRQRSEGKG